MRGCKLLLFALCLLIRYCSTKTGGRREICILKLDSQMSTLPNGFKLKPSIRSGSVHVLILPTLKIWRPVSFAKMFTQRDKKNSNYGHGSGYFTFWHVWFSMDLFNYILMDFSIHRFMLFHALVVWKWRCVAGQYPSSPVIIERVGESCTMTADKPRLIIAVPRSLLYFHIPCGLL